MLNARTMTNKTNVNATWFWYDVMKKNIKFNSHNNNKIYNENIQRNLNIANINYKLKYNKNEKNKRIFGSFNVIEFENKNTRKRIFKLTNKNVKF